MFNVNRRNTGTNGSMAALGTIALVLGVLGFTLLLVMAMDEATDAKAATRLGQAKQNLHEIQLSVERFWVDCENYPPYLIGGGRDYTTTVDPSAGKPFDGILVLNDLTQVPDPLVRQGYLNYPSNPFMLREGDSDYHTRIEIHALQLAIPGGGADPLRNGEGGAAATCGTRFGQFCQTMGQVLADPRYPQVYYSQYELPPAQPYPSYAGVGYPFWDIWAGAEPKPYLPGEFFYKSNGWLRSDAAATSAQGPVAPVKPNGYIMGVYGPLTEKGIDVIGAEQQVVGWTPGADGKLGWDTAGTQVWPWTRSTSAPGQYDGCPYLPGKPGAQMQYEYGNPNGVRDAIVMTLTDGAVLAKLQ